MTTEETDSSKLLAVSFNLELPLDLVTQLSELQQIARGITPELRNYDTTPHLAIATKFMPAASALTYLEALQKEFQYDKPFTLIFPQLTISNTRNYIFIEPDQASSDYVWSLRNRALAVSKEIGYETPNNQPALYPYSPHISIIKCDPVAVDATFSALQAHLAGISGKVNKFFITQETRRNDGFADFPTIGEIALQTT